MIGTLVKAVLFTLLGLGLLACGMHVAHSGRPEVPSKDPLTLRIGTFNVHWIALRMADGPWSPSGFEARKAPMAAMIETLQPDILALQEAESFPGTNRDGTNLVTEFLAERFPQYRLAATGAPSSFPPTQPILYDPARLQATDQGWFFFSDTPDVIYSRTFNGSWSAFASWAEFQPTEGGPNLRVVNVHTDYASRSNRRLSAALVRDRIAPWIAEGMNVVVVGDMNAMRGSATLELMEEAGVSFLPVAGATVHFNRGLNMFGAIDHIGLSEGLSAVGETVVLRDKFGDTWPSDHYPVFADIRVGGPS